MNKGGGVGSRGDSGKGRGASGEARSAAGILDNVVLLGAPIGVNPGRWVRARRVVHGRLINGYSSRDLTLGLVFRAKSLSIGVAGTQAVTCLPEDDGPGAGVGNVVENIDLSPVVESHFDYCRRMPEILPLLRLDDP
ncbi:unnamed protein product [Choristocarpus tenellus]